MDDRTRGNNSTIGERKLQSKAKEGKPQQADLHRRTL